MHGGWRIGVMVAWLAGSGGCMFFEDAGPEHAASVPLTAPWVELGLPVDGGDVTLSEPESMSVRFGGASPEVAAAPFADALTAGGWSRESDTSVPGVVNQTWAREGTTLALSAMARDGVTVVSISRLPF